MAMIMEDARKQKPLPLSITMSDAAYRKFADTLKSKSCFFPNENGSFAFLGIPVRLNRTMPNGCFTVERIATERLRLMGKR